LTVRSNGSGDDRSFVTNARRAQIVDAAIDTIAEVGYAKASLARIAVRLGISKGVISYHFAGKDDLVAEIIRQVLAQARAYMEPRIYSKTTGPEMLRAYIESNLEFIRDNPNQLNAVMEIARAAVADGKHPFRPNADAGVRLLAEMLARVQNTGELRPDFDPDAMAMAIRAAIDAATRRVIDPTFDIDQYANEIATLFHLATRVTED
jgi:AcrR family transcriptional regulator